MFPFGQYNLPVAGILFTANIQTYDNQTSQMDELIVSLLILVPRHMVLQGRGLTNTLNNVC